MKPKNLTLAQRAAVDLLIARLDPDDAGCAASNEVRVALKSDHLRIYLKAHVYPLLDMLRDGEQHSGQAHYAIRDAKRVREYRLVPELNPAAQFRATFGEK